MYVQWTYYTNKGRAEGIKQINHSISYIGTKEECEAVTPQRSQAYAYSILPSLTKPDKYCLHMVYNRYYDTF